MTSPRQRRPTHERQVEIADAALRVIAEQGIAVFTMERLAAEVGMTSGALFRHFASREEILAAAVKRAEDLLRTSFPDAALPPRERLFAFIRARTALVGEHAGLAQLVFSEQFMKALDAPSRQLMQEVARTSQQFLASTLAEAQAVGAIRRDLPAAHLAQVLMGAIIAAILMRRTGEAPPDELLNTLGQLLNPAPET